MAASASSSIRRHTGTYHAANGFPGPRPAETFPEIATDVHNGVRFCLGFGNQHLAIQMLAKDCLHYSTILYQNSSHLEKCWYDAHKTTDGLSIKVEGDELENYWAKLGSRTFPVEEDHRSPEHTNVLKKFSKVDLFSKGGTAMLVGKYEYRKALSAENRGINETLPKANENVVLVAFRGTNTLDALCKDLEFEEVKLCDDQEDKSEVYVHKGFKDTLEAVKDDLDRMLKKYESLPVLFTGHSLGGAVSLIAACRSRLQWDIKEKADRKAENLKEVGFITFGCPRAGNIPFCNVLDSIPLRLRLWAGWDPIVKLPPRHLNILEQSIIKLFGFFTAPNSKLMDYFETEVRYHLHLGRPDHWINYANLFYICDHNPDFYSQLMIYNDLNASPDIKDFLDSLPSWIGWIGAEAATATRAVGRDVEIAAGTATRAVGREVEIAAGTATRAVGREVEIAAGMIGREGQAIYHSIGQALNVFGVGSLNWDQFRSKL